MRSAASDTALTERMRITSGGNVGIGTTNPGATLEVKGTMKVFGAWESKSLNTVYQADTDGFAVVQGYQNVNVGQVALYTDSNNPPTTQRGRIAFDQGSYTVSGTITCPVKKGDYWKVTGAGTQVIYWIPLGN